MQPDSEVRGGQEGAGRAAGLQLALRRSGQHNVVGLQARLALSQAEQRTAGADLYVIWVRPDREHGQRAARWNRQLQWQHGGHHSDGDLGTDWIERVPVLRPIKPDRSGSHTIQGQFPRWYISSSCARSFTVSAGDQ